jgi:hypothetical protein
MMRQVAQALFPVASWSEPHLVPGLESMYPLVLQFYPGHNGEPEY